MKRSPLTPARMLVGIAIALVIASFLPAPVASALSGPPRQILDTTLAPLTAPLHAIGRNLRPPQRRELELDDQHHPGQTLAYIRQLEQQLTQLQQQNQALAQVRQVTGERSDIAAVSARVTSATRRGPTPTLRLNRGRRDGVEIGDVVVSGFNLVGRVEELSYASARVRPINSAGTALMVRIVPAVADAPPRTWQTLARLAETGRHFDVEATVEDPIQEGDLAHLADPRWPDEAQGFIIGQVTAIEPDPSDPHMGRLVRIAPFIAPDAVATVNVLIMDDE